jgi:hypothetical protein
VFDGALVGAVVAGDEEAGSRARDADCCCRENPHEGDVALPIFFGHVRSMDLDDAVRKAARGDSAYRDAMRRVRPSR